jgi:ATP-dependent DNA ligase
MGIVSAANLRRSVSGYCEPANFSPIARALTHLRCRSCIIDGEAVICIASFNYIRYRRNDGDVFLYAFDLIVLLERWGGKLLERRVDEGA